MQNQDEIIGKIFPQNCGDSVIVLEKTNEKENKQGNYLFKIQYQKYFYIELKSKRDILRGSCINPRIEEEEFINKKFNQTGGEILKVIRKINKYDKYNHPLYEIQFQKYPYIDYRTKQDILKGRCLNPEIERIEFLEKEWPQHCGDIIKIIEKTKLKEKTNCLYRCQFIKYPYEILTTKGRIIKGNVNNPQIEQINLLSKLWPQNCGDTLKIIEKTNIKDTNKNLYLWKCEFQTYFNIVYAVKKDIINGEVNNIKIPYQTKEGILNVIKEKFPNRKPTLLELISYFNISISTLGHKIIEFSLQEYINYYHSYKENDVFDFIKSLYKEEIKRGAWNILKNKEIDIYLSKLKIGFEFNGNFWHSNHPKFGKENNYHQEKSLLAKEKGLKLFHIFEYEWNEKREQIKSYIKTKLGIFEYRIGASKCKIEEVNVKEYQDFCNKNHLQGECGAKIKLGLYYKNELVQIMSFGSPRFTDKYEWEILRECSKLGWCILGGKQKLWNYFIKKYQPNSVISYCDFSKFTGESYLKLGFEFKQLNKPGFVWYDNKLNQVYWRDPFHHKEMKGKGYLQIYDAGQLVFVWNKKV